MSKYKQSQTTRIKNVLGKILARDNSNSKNNNNKNEVIRSHEAKHEERTHIDASQIVGI